MCAKHVVDFSDLEKLRVPVPVAIRTHANSDFQRASSIATFGSLDVADPPRGNRLDIQLPA